MFAQTTHLLPDTSDTDLYVECFDKGMLHILFSFIVDEDLMVD